VAGTDQTANDVAYSKDFTNSSTTFACSSPIPDRPFLWRALLLDSPLVMNRAI